MKGTILRVCLAAVFAGSVGGFLIFLVPVSTGILNIGNAVGMFVCAALFALSLCWRKFFPFVLEHRPLRIFIIVLTMLAVLLIALAIVLSVLMIRAADNPPPGDSAVVILGCKVKGEEPSLMLRNRVMAAAEYLTIHPGSVCVCSGGQGGDELISEAECMKRILLENGIPESRIILEDRSTTTDENIRFSLEKLSRSGFEGDVTIVTSEFHQLRAKMIAKGYGLDSFAISSSTAAYLLPTYWLREWFGICYQAVFGVPEG